MAPVYGLAENCVGLAFPPLGRGPLIDRIRRDDLARAGRAVPANAEEIRARSASSPAASRCPATISVSSMRPGSSCPERHEGRLQFRGPSATCGYWRNDAATRLLLDGDWRETGDLAYVADGDLYITARVKDLIIRGGRNIHPADIESGVGTIDGVLPGRVVAFGDTANDRGSERLIVVAETRRRDARRPGRAARRDQRTGRRAGRRSRPTKWCWRRPTPFRALPAARIRRQASRDLVALRPHRRRRFAVVADRRCRLGDGHAARPQHAGACAPPRGLLFAAWAWTALFLLVAARVAGVRCCCRSCPGGGERSARRRDCCSSPPARRWRSAAWSGSTIGRACWSPITPATSTCWCWWRRCRARSPSSPRRNCAPPGTPGLPMQRIGMLLRRALRPQAGAGRLPANRRRGAPGPFAAVLSRRYLPPRSRADALPHGRLRVCGRDASLPVIPVVLRGTRAILPSGSWFPRRGRVEVTIRRRCPPRTGRTIGPRH